MKSKKAVIAWLALLLFLGAAFFFLKESPKIEETHEPPSHVQEEEPAPSPTPSQPQQEEPQKSLPASFTLAVPFTPQAPTANWDTLHDEACEEASAIMTAAFFRSDTRNILPASEVEQEIEKLTAWQQENFGYSLSINSEEAALMIESVYGLEAEVITDFSEESIKRMLTENKLILVPANGRKLGNPNFTPPGPIYHMLVITGYDQQSFIVNDPGTKYGQEYRYTYQTIKNANGDYDHKTKAINPSRPAIIIVSK